MIQTKTNRPFIPGIALCLALLVSSFSFSQSKIDSLLGKLDPQRFAASISKKADKLEEKLVAKSMKVLSSMEKQEKKLYSKMLHGKDSLMANEKLAELSGKYSSLKDKLKNPAVISTARTYLPKLDSFSTSLKFLDQNGIGGKVKDALAKTTALQDKFQQAEEIKKFIRERKEQLKAQLEKLGTRNGGQVVKQLKQINKKIFYYSEQLKSYRKTLNDPKKIEKKALELLSKTKWFKDFFKKNSMLASLFRMQPDNPSDPAYLASLAGLQTRVQVNSLIQQTIAGAGPNGMQQFQQQMQGAQSQMNELKNKINQFGGGSSDDIMPEGFTPSTQKTKSFLKRLEIGTNIQTQKSTNFFPTTSDVALSVGYKLNDKSIIGIGGGTKIGLGRGWNNIRFSYEGISLRSFIDWKLKGNLWISGGYERNYRETLRGLGLRSLDGWQSSGLIGLSKSVPVKSKFFKKTKLQLLWDFLAQQQIPRTQSFIFRVGYNFK